MQTANRLIDLLETVARSPRPIGLMDLVRLTGIDKSVASRLLHVLAVRGLVARDSTSKLYAVGPALVSLSLSAYGRVDLQAVCEPYLTQLRDATGETSTLHIRLGDSRVCIGGVESRHAVRRVVPLGDSLPLYRGASGKVILAQLTGEEAESVFDAASRDAVDLTALRSQLRAIREAGYAIRVGDRTPGVCALSACLHGERALLGSITVAGPIDRWDASTASATAPLVAGAAQDISRALRGTLTLGESSDTAAAPVAEIDGLLQVSGGRR